MSQIPDPNAVPPSGDVPPPPGQPSYMPPSSYPTPPLLGGYAGPPPASEDRSMAMLCYILGIFGLAGWIGPLIIWLTKKDTSPFINDQGKEVLNWELTIIPAYILGFFMFCIPFIGPIFAFLLFAGTGVTNLVFCILGAIKVNDGVAYRMPFSIKYIK